MDDRRAQKWNWIIRIHSLKPLKKAENLTVSQQQIDEALELICPDLDVIDLTQKPLDLAMTIAKKAKPHILANSAANCRDDLEYEFTEQRIQPMHGQARSIITDRFPESKF